MVWLVVGDGHTIIVGFGSMTSTNVGNFIQDGNLT